MTEMTPTEQMHNSSSIICIRIRYMMDQRMSPFWPFNAHKLSSEIAIMGNVLAATCYWWFTSSIHPYASHSMSQHTPPSAVAVTRFIIFYCHFFLFGSAFAVESKNNSIHFLFTSRTLVICVPCHWNAHCFILCSGRRSRSLAYTLAWAQAHTYNHHRFYLFHIRFVTRRKFHWQRTKSYGNGFDLLWPFFLSVHVENAMLPDFRSTMSTNGISARHSIAPAICSQFIVNFMWMCAFAFHLIRLGCAIPICSNSYSTMSMPKGQCRRSWNCHCLIRIAAGTLANSGNYEFVGKMVESNEFVGFSSQRREARGTGNGALASTFVWSFLWVLNSIILFIFCAMTTTPSTSVILEPHRNFRLSLSSTQKFPQWSKFHLL